MVEGSRFGSVRRSAGKAPWPTEGPVSVLVVYEPSLGNVRQVALAIAEGVSTALENNAVVAVSAADRVDPVSAASVHLLLVGGSAQAFGVPRQRSPQGGARGGPAGRDKRGVRDWIDALPRCNRDVVAATFDTRAQDLRHSPGSAVRGALRQMGRHGFRTGVHESFYVDSATGPLVAGEESRARAWGQQLVGDMRLTLALSPRP